MLRIGIIGSGFGLYGLLPAFYSLKNCAVVSVCASNQERLSKHYYSLGLNNVYSDWRKMLDMEKIDALAIAVTPSAQYTIAKTAIQKGIHVFAEKPLADTYEHAKTLYDLALKHKVTHAIDFLFPEIDEWMRVKKLLENNKYGKLKHISVNWDFLSHDIKHGISSWKTDAQKGGGALSFYFSHSLYYLEYFAGAIEDVKSAFSHSEKSVNGAEVEVDLLLRFKNNTQGSSHISCNTIGLNRHQLIFRCEKGTIQLENRNSFVRNFKITIYTENGEKSINTHKKTTKSDEKARVDVIKNIAERFVSACIHRQQMKPSMKEGARVAQLIKIIKATLL
jgi:predicted dehydrogenase